MAHFVFMLTHGDRTVEHAAEIVPELADTGLSTSGSRTSARTRRDSVS